MLRNTMRDGSTDYETGWLYDGYYDVVAPRAASGFAGQDSTGDRLVQALRSLPPAGRKYAMDAMRDPSAKPIVTKLLLSWNPSAALAKQAEQDLAEAVKSTGKVIVFKTLVRKLVGRLKAVEDAMVRAQDPNNPIGRTAIGIALTSKNPHKDVQEFLTDVAFAAIAPDAQIVVDEDVPPELAGLGKSFFKKLKSAATKVVQKIEAVAHNPNVRKAAVAVAVIGAVALTGGAIIPALASAAPIVAGAAGSTFKKTPEQIASETTGTVGPVWDPVRAEWVQPVATPAAGGAAAGGGFNLASIAGVAVDIYKLKMTGDIAKASMLNQQALEQLKAQGMSEAQAQSLINQGMQQAAESYGPQQAPAPGGPSQQFFLPGGGGGGAPVEASMFSPDTIKYGLIAVVSLGTLYGISQAIRGGGGSRHRSRRR